MAWMHQPHMPSHVIVFFTCYNALILYFLFGDSYSPVRTWIQEGVFGMICFIVHVVILMVMWLLFGMLLVCDPGIVGRKVDADLEFDEVESVDNNQESKTREKDEKFIAHENQNVYDSEPSGIVQQRSHAKKREFRPFNELMSCRRCNLEDSRPPGSHHCRICEHCVEAFDHHCWWLQRDIGRANILMYRGFLGSIVFLLARGFLLVRR